VTAVGGGAFTVTGANTFAAAGSYQVTVAIRDTAHDLQLTVQGTAIVQDATGVPAPQPAPLQHCAKVAASAWGDKFF
jgi:hypothetical protein